MYRACQVLQFSEKTASAMLLIPDPSWSRGNLQIWWLWRPVWDIMLVLSTWIATIPIHGDKITVKLSIKNVIKCSLINQHNLWISSEMDFKIFSISFIQYFYFQYDGINTNYNGSLSWIETATDLSSSKHELRDLQGC